MDKIVIFMSRLLDWIVNLLMLAAAAVLLAWIIWDVPPQTSFTKTAQFFSDGWTLITGKNQTDMPKQQVTKGQLKESAEKTNYYYGK